MSMIQSSYTQETIQQFENVQKQFLIFTSYVLKIKHDYQSSVYEKFNWANLYVRSKVLDIRFINSLVKNEIDANHLLNIMSHFMYQGLSCELYIDINSILASNYLCNDPIQRIMRFIIII